MTDRERYIQARKEARRYHRKYLRYKNAWARVLDRVVSSKDAEIINEELGKVQEVENG